MNILSLEGRVALVTGAGQGVGRQIALHFSAHGAGAVIVNDYVLERAEAVAREISRSGGRAMAAQADVTDLDAVRRMVAEVKAAHGEIGVLVNNAGNEGANPSPEVAQPFWETGPEVWANHLGVNLHGVINCASAVIPGMIEAGRGRIVTVISDAGRMGEPGLEIYSGAKAGAAGFMRAIARSLGRHNIAANCVSIAATMTPRVAPSMAAMSPERRKRMLEKYVIRRLGEPGDVANMVLFLAAEANSWITGQTYPVNGGFSFSL